tara:strand:- start:692 stop:907 length:216 start_codon:yes stop_codon:yes gene_type:complete
MKGWFLNIALLEDRFILILFNLLKIGIIRTNSEGFNGISIVLGLYKLELQINLSLVNDIKIKYKDYEAGRA